MSSNAITLPVAGLYKIGWHARHRKRYKRKYEFCYQINGATNSDLAHGWANLDRLIQTIILVPKRLPRCQLMTQ